MLKRVAVLSKDDAFHKDVARAAKGKGIEVFGTAAAAKLPHATVAAIGDKNSAAALIRAASVLGTRQDQLLELLAEAIDCREGLLPGSSARVRDHATRLAKALKLNDDDQLTLERGALLRDIGKLKIHNEVLLKFDVLTYDEWRHLHQHTSFGADLAAQLGDLKDIATIVQSHHECYDGTGYPKGLEGDSIPFLARAVKVIDVYCAMTSPRGYRSGKTSHAAALEYIKSESGKHFDPEIVKAFVTGKVAKPNRTA